jgi:hypothetical protein
LIIINDYTYLLFIFGQFINKLPRLPFIAVVIGKVFTNEIIFNISVKAIEKSSFFFNLIQKNNKYDFSCKRGCFEPRGGFRKGS